jgi:predicted nucleic acid-binding Zn ribbon protein
MPTFRFQCQKCRGEFEEWHSIHDPHPTTHQSNLDPLDINICGGRLVQVITAVNTYAVGERGKHTKVSDATDRVWHKDMDAYSRLRREGLQPQRITGADKLEATAVGTRHIETGQRYTDRQVSDGMERARQIIREGAK